MEGEKAREVDWDEVDQGRLEATSRVALGGGDSVGF